MPKDIYKISSQLPAGFSNTNIPTSDHSTSNVKSVGDGLSAAGTFFPKENAKGGSSSSLSQQGPYGKEK
jgi:hypothetical protein